MVGIEQGMLSTDLVFADWEYSPDMIGINSIQALYLKADMVTE